jgi:hypothetical protein
MGKSRSIFAGHMHENAFTDSMREYHEERIANLNVTIRAATETVPSQLSTTLNPYNQRIFHAQASRDRFHEPYRPYRSLNILERLQHCPRSGQRRVQGRLGNQRGSQGTQITNSAK